MTNNPDMDMNIHIKVPKQEVDQVVQNLDNIDKRFKAVTNSIVMEGRKLSMIGAEFKRIGDSILGPLTQAADEYAKRYKGLEAPANNFIAAQQRQADAMSSLGRVAATALIPKMNELASITEKIASFATAHPELVNTAVNIGSVMAASGATLVAVGQIGATLGRIQQLVSSGGLVGNLTQAIIGIGAFAGGLKLGEIAVNAYGKAVGDSTLEHYKLTDALKSVRELIGIAFLPLAQAFIDAKKTFSELVLIVQGVGVLIKNAFDGILDRIATSFREIPSRFEILLNSIHDKFVDMLNGLIGFINSTFHTNIALGGHVAYRDGTMTPEGRIAIEEGNFNERDDMRKRALQTAGDQMVVGKTTIDQTYKQDQANLAKIAGAFANFGTTGSFGSVADSILGGVKNLIGQFFSGGKPTVTNAAATNTLSPEAVNAYIDFRKQQADADRKYAQDSQRITTDYHNNELKAQKAQADKIAKIILDNATAVADEIEKQQQQQRKDVENYEFNETEIKKKAEFDRLQNMKKAAYDQLKFVADRDVAGFVEAQLNATFEDQQKQAQDAFDQQQRKDQFDHEEAQKAEDNQIALNNLKRDGQRKIDEANRQFKQEDDARKQAYKDQLDALDQHHKDEKTLIEQHFAEQLANLNDNLIGLRDLQLKHFGDMTQDAKDYINSHKGDLRSLLLQSLGISDTSATTTAQSGGSTAPALASMPTLNTTPIYGDYYTQYQQQASTVVNIGNMNYGSVATPQDVQTAASNVFNAVQSAMRTGVSSQ